MCNKKRKHASFSKLKVGDYVIDNTEERFKILEIDKIGRVLKVQDPKSNDKIWIPALYINKPWLLDLCGDQKT